MRPAVFSPRRNVFRAGPSRGSRSSGAADDTLFLALDGDSALANLSASMTVNGATVAPTAFYAARDADAAAWAANGYGAALAIAGSGTAPTTGTSAPTTASADRAVRLGGGINGKAYVAADAAFADVTTEDLVVEIVFQAGASSGHIVGKYPGGPGYAITQEGTSLRVTLHDGTDFPNLSAAGLVVGAWYHALIAIDRDDTFGVRIFLNGVSAASGTLSPAAQSLSTPGAFSIGNRSIAGYGWNGQVAHVALWKRDAWFAGGATNTTDWTAVAEERFRRLAGVWPSRAAGAYAPTLQTRASTATLDHDRDGDGVRRLFLVGAGWPRLCRRKSASSSTYVRGYLPEAQTTNLCLQSADLSTTWTPTAATISANGAEAPDGTTTADGIVADGTASDHIVEQTITLTAASYTWSQWFKSGNQPRARMRNATLAASATFHLSGAGSVAATSGAVTAAISSWGGGWYRCSITFTGTAAAHVLDAAPANAFGVTGFVGDGSVSVWAWGAQVEAKAYPSSYIPTTTASATRVADRLRVTAVGNVADGRGTLEATILSENVDTAGGTIAAIHVANSSIDSIFVQEGAADVLVGQGVTAGVLQVGIVGTTNISDGNAHAVKHTWETNDARLFVDGAGEGTPDTVCTPATGMQHVDIGSRENGTAQYEGLIADFRIRSTPRTS